MKYKINARATFEAESDSRAQAYVIGARMLMAAGLPGFDLNRMDVIGPSAGVPVKLESGKVVGEVTGIESDPDGITVSARVDDPATAGLITASDGVTYGPFSASGPGPAIMSFNQPVRASGDTIVDPVDAVNSELAKFKAAQGTTD